MTKILQPLWMLLTWATEPEMVWMAPIGCLPTTARIPYRMLVDDIQYEKIGSNLPILRGTPNGCQRAFLARRSVYRILSGIINGMRASKSVLMRLSAITSQSDRFSCRMASMEVIQV